MPSLGRFEDLGPLGAGGMGEVRRVRDPVLGRVLALKLLPLARTADLEARFLAEARVCASLEHPGIVPVHELGWLPDGRAWFTMREIRGRTFGQVLAERPPTRRSLDQLLRVAEAVAFAHAHGVVHRDLKPSNLLVGEYGEVFVVDWGIAKVVGAPDGPADAARVAAGPGLTVDGAVVGTPAYMSPEQAAGESERIGPATDVWGLGAVLYEVLAGRPPLEGDAFELLARLSDPRLLVRRVATPTPIDHALWDLCERCLRREPGDRFAHAGEVADALRAWLEGERSRERAIGDVALAEGFWTRAAELRSGAHDLDRRAATALAALPPTAPEPDRYPAWACQDEAADLRTKAALAEVAADQAMGAALAAVPLLPEAHALLAGRWRAEAEGAEDARDPERAARAQALLERHVRALPDDHPARATHLAWLAGDASVELRGDAAGDWLLERGVVRERRVVYVPERAVRLPATLSLPAGTWRLCAPGSELRFPFALRRGQTARQALALPPPPPPGTVFVAPGPFVAGGHHHRERRVLWCDGFAIGRFPVTMGEYVAFLDDLVAAGREAEAVRHAPQVPLGRHGDGPPLLARGPDGRFRFGKDADGDDITPDLPALCVDWAGAVAYAAWLRGRTGLPWRLPGDLEWEKAARGVDGRTCPWGEQPDPSRANTRDSSARAAPRPVDSFPVDTSPFGLRGAAGNVRDWTADAWSETWSPLDGDRVVPPPLDPPPAARVVGRGGAWPLGAGQCTALVRVEDRPEYRHPGVGFRVACAWP